MDIRVLRLPDGDARGALQGEGERDVAVADLRLNRHFGPRVAVGQSGDDGHRLHFEAEIVGGRQQLHVHRVREVIAHPHRDARTGADELDLTRRQDAHRVERLGGLGAVREQRRVPRLGCGDPRDAQQLQDLGPLGSGEQGRVVEDGGELGERRFLRCECGCRGHACVVDGDIVDLDRRGRRVHDSAEGEGLDGGCAQGGRDRGPQGDPRPVLAAIEGDQERGPAGLGDREREIRGRRGEVSAADGRFALERRFVQLAGDGGVVDQGSRVVVGAARRHGRAVRTLRGRLGGDHREPVLVVDGQCPQRLDDIGARGSRRRPEHPGPGPTDVEERAEVRIDRSQRVDRGAGGGRRLCGRFGHRCEVGRRQIGLQRGRLERGHEPGLHLGRDIRISELQGETRVGERVQPCEPADRAGRGGCAQRANRRGDSRVDGEDRLGVVDGIELGGEGAVGGGQLGELECRQEPLRGRRCRDRHDDAQSDRRGGVVGHDDRARRCESAGRGRERGDERVDARREPAQGGRVGGDHQAVGLLGTRADGADDLGRDLGQGNVRRVAGEPGIECGAARREPRRRIRARGSPASTGAAVPFSSVTDANSASPGRRMPLPTGASVKIASPGGALGVGDGVVAATAGSDGAMSAAAATRPAMRPTARARNRRAGRTGGSGATVMMGLRSCAIAGRTVCAILRSAPMRPLIAARGSPVLAAASGRHG